MSDMAARATQRVEARARAAAWSLCLLLSAVVAGCAAAEGTPAAPAATVTVAPSPTVSAAPLSATPGVSVPPTPLPTRVTATSTHTLAPPTPTRTASPTSTRTPRPATTQDIDGLLAPVRDKYKLPALGAAIVSSQGLLAMGAVGVRKAGTNIPVTVDDEWHLGSDTKAMTATMIGALVEQGKLRWDMTLEEIFPDLAGAMNPQFRKVTILQMLSMRAGFPNYINWDQIVQQGGTLRAQRLQGVKVAAAAAPLYPPGTQTLYSGVGYMMATAMAERVTNEAWETLITQLLFRRLGMTSAGFGGTGTPGKIDQPWPHTSDGKPTPINGPTEDNPPVVGPAGNVHATLADWSKYIVDQLRGERAEPALLKPETYHILHTPPFGGDYALGWAVDQRDWGGGTVLDHAGSNTINYALVWIAPQRDFAVLVVTNEGGDSAGQATDEASGALIQYYLSR